MQPVLSSEFAVSPLVSVLAGLSEAGFVQQWSSLDLPHLPVSRLAILFQRPGGPNEFEPAVFALLPVSAPEEAPPR
jgi:hypothetical protein